MPTDALSTLLAFLEESPDAAFVADLSGRIRFISEHAAQLTAWPAAQATGQPLDEVLLLSHQPGAERIDGALLLQGSGRAQYILRSREGKEQRVEVHASALPAVGPDAEAAVVILVRDLGPAGAYEVTDHFLGVLSHALRTPLNAMAGWLYVLKAGAAVPETMARKALDGITRAVEQQQRLVEDMGDMALIVTGRLKMEVHPIDIRPAMDAAVNEVAPQAMAKGVRLQQERAPTGVRAIADAARLQQALRYLLANAVKYTPTGGEIVVAAEDLGGHIEIRVSDNGEPIPQAMLPFVFDRFGRGDSTLTRGDDGFGLTLVRKLVELQGGHVTARSAGDAPGANFAIRLATGEPPAQTARRKAVAAAQPGSDQASV
jgi:PAS domain S-box-containing protein